MKKQTTGRVALCILLSLAAIFMAACSGLGQQGKGPQSGGDGSVGSSSAQPLPPEASQPEEDPLPEPPARRYLEEGGLFELPLGGAAGWTAVALELWAQPHKARENAVEDQSGQEQTEEALQTLPAGTPFTILEEQGDWWLVEGGSFTGWLPHAHCMINLPDVVPSVVYDNANTYSSLYTSSGKSIPGITGETLYQGRQYNHRLGREEYIMPALYTLAKKVCAAQQLALAAGDCLKIHEAYRSYTAQNAVMVALDALAQQDTEVMAGISTAPWSLNWFIATGVSNHQVGYAVDLTLVRAEELGTAHCGEWEYPVALRYTEYEMPTPIHELSAASAAFTGPVRSWSDTEWRIATPAESMNEAALALQKYCTEAGLTPLASEWWHFNDLQAMQQTEEMPGKGDFTAEMAPSQPPATQVTEVEQ